MVNVKKWTLLLIITFAITAALISYALFVDPPSPLEEERHHLNYALSLMNTTEISRRKIAPVKRNILTTANMSPSQLQFASWTEGVVTQLHPKVKRNCTKLMAGDKTEMAHVAEALSTWKPKSNTVDFFIEISDCYRVQKEFNNSFYVSTEEENFPIAYILIVYTNPQQIVWFLKAVYRTYNIYCIHPDLKSGKGFAAVFNLLSKCLQNVFVASHIQEVQYARNTIFEAQLSCYQDLDKYPDDKWHYVINLTGRELPLKTNYEIVESLRTMNGTSIMRPNPVDSFTMHERFYRQQRTEDKPIYTSELLGPPPFQIELYKSSSYNALSRVFVQFFLHNETVQTFMQWIKHAWVPEEHFYASVYMMPESPGGHLSLHPIKSQALVSYSIWKHKKNSPFYSPLEKCDGKSIHEVCILNSAELPRVRDALKWNMWFFNKYFMEDDHVIMDCVEEVLVKKNIEEFQKDSHVLTSTRKF